MNQVKLLLSIVLFLLAMIQATPPQRSLPFVTDFDKTIAFYKVSSVSLSSIVALPASSSGMRGYLSKETIQIFEELGNFHPIICASGMREATMRSRQPFLPMIRYWICENGGKIFEWRKHLSEPVLEEIEEWRDYLLSDGVGSKALLEEFKGFVRQRYCSDTSSPLKIDDEGYSFLFRVKAKSRSSKECVMALREVVSQISPSLSYSYNLGFLDIHLPRCTKYSAVKWLLQHHFNLGDVPNEEVKPFIFMGDDDNDVEIATHARLAMIVKDRSPLMEEFVQNIIREKKMISRDDLSVTRYESEDGDGRELWLGRRSSFDGSNDLLRTLLLMSK